MIKKMKGVALEKSVCGLSEGSKSRLKHHRLIQDYQELQKETEAAKNKLAITNQRKLTLLAEVRFLRQRRKHLLEMKAENPQEMHTVLLKCQKNSTKEKKCSKKEMNTHSKPPMWNLNMKEMTLSIKSTLQTKESYISRIENKKIGKEAFLGNKNLGFNLNKKKRINGTKVVTFKHPHPSEVHDLKQKERTNSQKKNFGLDLNQVDGSYAEGEKAVQNRAPVFDLNLKLDEEDLQETSRCEEPKNIFDNGNEELNDLKSLICENVEVVPNRSEKRKISWEEPFALKLSSISPKLHIQV